MGTKQPVVRHDRLTDTCGTSDWALLHSHSQHKPEPEFNQDSFPIIGIPKALWRCRTSKTLSMQKRGLGKWNTHTALAAHKTVPFCVTAAPDDTGGWRRGKG